LRIEDTAKKEVLLDFKRAIAAPEPDASSVSDHVFAPTPVSEEKGTREPAGAEKLMMVDAALFALREIMEDVLKLFLWSGCWSRLAVYSEAATLADRFGDLRVFNTAMKPISLVQQAA
jgi:2-oxoisovalerate dehydrogenase E1 component